MQDNLDGFRTDLLADAKRHELEVDAAVKQIQAHHTASSVADTLGCALYWTHYTQPLPGCSSFLVASTLYRSKRLNSMCPVCALSSFDAVNQLTPGWSDRLYCLGKYPRLFGNVINT